MTPIPPTDCGDRRPVWVGTSWKMNKALDEARAYAEKLASREKTWSSGVRVFLVPPFTALAVVRSVLENTRILLGAQNLHWESCGAYTGEISAAMIRDCGADLVEIGHFERRTMFGETDEIVNHKVAAAVRHDLRPLVCIGEGPGASTLQQAGDYVLGQVEAALRGLDGHELNRLMLAYEPGWAIGVGGRKPDCQHIANIQQTIRMFLCEAYGQLVCKATPILYGGGVTAGNSAELMSSTGVDGLFVGRAGLDVTSLLEVVASVDAVTATSSAGSRQ